MQLIVVVKGKSCKIMKLIVIMHASFFFPSPLLADTRMIKCCLWKEDIRFSKEKRGQAVFVIV